VHEAGASVDTEEKEWLRQALHDISQPMTALECGLFIGTMSPDGVRAPTAEELLETILGALAQCERVTTHLRAMQEKLLGD
jgi:hypothetical protein